VLAFLKQKYYIENAIGLSFYFFETKTGRRETARGSAPHKIQPQAGSYGTDSPGHFYLFSVFLLSGIEERREQKGGYMPYWIHCDRQAQEGDLRRIQLLTSDELSLQEDLRGPFNTLEDALRIVESLIWSIVAKVLERLRTEKPKQSATFPIGGQTPEE
jgi:hypothetical protein